MNDKHGLFCSPDFLCDPTSSVGWSYKVSDTIIFASLLRKHWHREVVPLAWVLLGVQATIWAFEVVFSVPTFACLEGMHLRDYHSIKPSVKFHKQEWIAVILYLILVNSFDQKASAQYILEIAPWWRDNTNMAFLIYMNSLTLSLHKTRGLQD